MPTIRRMSRTSIKSDSLSDDQREHLIRGSNLLFIDFPFRSDAERKQLYFQHRDELIEAMGPDKRCHAWWCYEAKVRRRIVSGDESLAMWEKGEYFGKCKVYNIESWKDPRRPIFEPEVDYLKRHGRAIRFKK